MNELGKQPTFVSSIEVKEEILAKVKAGEAAASVAEKYGISAKTIYGWLRWNTVKGVSWLEHAKLSCFFLGDWEEKSQESNEPLWN